MLDITLDDLPFDVLNKNAADEF